MECAQSQEQQNHSSRKLCGWLWATCQDALPQRAQTEGVRKPIREPYVAWRRSTSSIAGLTVGPKSSGFDLVPKHPNRLPACSVYTVLHSILSLHRSTHVCVPGLTQLP